MYLSPTGEDLYTGLPVEPVSDTVGDEEFAEPVEVEPYAQYNVTVFAQTRGGIGDAVSVSFITPDGGELSFCLYICTYKVI